MRNLRWRVPIFLGSLFLLACLLAYRTKPDKTLQEFFTKDGLYFHHLPMHRPDSCMARIKNEVPEKWQFLACQGLYYWLPEHSPQVFEHLDCFEKAFPSDSMRAFTQMVRGELLTRQARFDTARACLSESIHWYKKLKKPKNIGDAKRFFSRTYLSQGDFPEAIRLLLEAREWYGQIDSLAENDRFFNLHLDLATAYIASKDYREALKWSQKIYTYAWGTNFAGVNFGGFKIVSAGVLAQNYIYLHRPDSAVAMAKLALESQYRFQNYYEIDQRHFILAEAYRAAGDCQMALQHYQQATCCISPEANRIKFFKYDQATADCYMGLGRLDLARIFYEKCLSSPDTVALAEVHGGLSQVFRKRGAFAQALFHADESRRLHDLAFNAEKTRIVTNLNLKFANAEQEKHIAQIKHDQQVMQQKNLIFLLFLTLTLVIIFILFIRQRGQNLLLEKEKQLATAREALQKQALQRSQADLAAKSQELEQTAQTLGLKNRLVEELKLQIFEQPAIARGVWPDDKAAERPGKKSFQQLKILTDDDWLTFRERFESFFPSMLWRMQAQLPSLTSAETRLFLLLKLGFEMKEISAVLGISVESVWRSRHRLSKKLGLRETGGLDGFVLGFA